MNIWEVGQWMNMGNVLVIIFMGFHHNFCNVVAFLAIPFIPNNMCQNNQGNGQFCY